MLFLTALRIHPHLYAAILALFVQAASLVSVERGRAGLTQQGAGEVHG